MNIIQLAWPSFSVDVAQVNEYFKANLSSNYNGVVGSQQWLAVMFTTDYSDADSTAVNTYWNGLTSTSFQPSVSQQVSVQISNAMQFGTQLLVQYATQNVLAGITQAGKTQALMDYSHELTHCLITGSLYAAMAEINTMLADTSSTKTNLSPFLTNVILTTYLNQIQTYLGIPVT